jgi:REP element-mobilizing transposase RayT
VHVTLRVVGAIGSLRRRRAYGAVRWATITTAARGDFRIVHVSIQRAHIHLIVEAEDKGALATGMQGFQISAAKHLNAAFGAQHKTRRRRGAVFPDRYHAKLITTPRYARRALNYVLNDWRHHDEDTAGWAKAWPVDPFSSAGMFPDFVEFQDQPCLWRRPPTYDPLLVRRPRSWLLRVGWKRAGAISYADRPAT